MKGKIGYFFLGIGVTLVLIMAIMLISIMTNPRIKRVAGSLINKNEAGFKCAEYDKYNKTGLDDLKGDPIFITLTDDVTVHTDYPSPDLYYVSGFTDDGEWMATPAYLENLNKFLDDCQSAKVITLYGYYFGYSTTEKMPAMIIIQAIVDDKVYSSKVSSFAQR